MTLAQLPVDFTPKQFMQLDRTSLDAVPYSLKRWRCQAKGCSNGTYVRDYSIHPCYLLHRNSKNAIKKPEKYWRKLDFHFWMCGKHHQLYKRLIKSFGMDHIHKRLCDFDKERVVDLAMP